MPSLPFTHSYWISSHFSLKLEPEHLVQPARQTNTHGILIIDKKVNCSILQYLYNKAISEREKRKLPFIL